MDLLPALEFAYNNSEQASTHATPFSLQSPISPLLPPHLIDPFPPSSHPRVESYRAQLQEALADAKRHLQSAQRRQKEYADRSRRLRTPRAKRSGWILNTSTYPTSVQPISYKTSGSGRLRLPRWSIPWQHGSSFPAR